MGRPQTPDRHRTEVVGSPECLHRRDGFGRAELKPSRINLSHHGGADGFSRLLLSHQTEVTGDAEIDPRPHLQGMGPIGIQGRSVPAQTVGHAERPSLKTLEAGLLHGLQGAATIGLAHHRRQSQKTGIEITAELIGHHHRGAAFSVDGVVLTVPEERVKIATGLLQPVAELTLFRRRVEARFELQGLGNGQTCLQRCDPEGTAVGTHALQGPVVKRLIRGSTVIRQAVIVDVEPLEITKGLHCGEPALGQETHVLATGGELEGAPHLQHEVTAQIFPEIAVLIGRVVGRIPGDLIRRAEIVRCRPFDLAVGLDAAFSLGEIPPDRPLTGVSGRNGSGETS